MGENILNLDDPDQYECFIRHFEIGHGNLHVLIRPTDNRKDKRHIVFSSVEYFSGAIRWNGANFVMRPDEETLAILHKVDRFDGVSDEKLLARRPSYKLYEVQTDRDVVQIVARDAQVIKAK